MGWGGGGGGVGCMEGVGGGGQRVIANFITGKYLLISV